LKSLTTLTKRRPHEGRRKGGQPLLRRQARAVRPPPPPPGTVSWNVDTDANIRLELAHEPGVAVDVIAGVVRGSARMAVQAARLFDLVAALKTKTVRISASQPIRIEPVEGPDVLMLLATTAWAKPRIGRAAA